MNDPNWDDFEYEFKLHLGEIVLASSVLPVLRRVYSLPEIREASAQSSLPRLSATSAGYLLSNIPQACAAHSCRREDGWLVYCLKSYSRSYIDMSGDFDVYQAKFSSKTRSGIKRKVKKFGQQAGGLDFRSYRTPAEVETFFELARPVSAASYQERLLDCGLPTDADFHRRSAAAAAQDNVRAFLLFAKGAPVSYLYCPIRDGIIEYAYLGFVPEFAKLSPGTVLQWLAMQQLFSEQRFSAFDFTEGDSEHKRFFGTHQVPCSLQLILRPTLKNRALLLAHRSIEKVSLSIVRLLDRFGLKKRLKQWIRRIS